MGFAIPWSDHLRQRFAGTPLKRIALSFGRITQRGEAMITEAGIEGGAIYALSAALRDALEQEQLVSAKRVSQALLVTDSEIAQLKNTAIALRETLEQTGRQREQAVQAAVLAASQEIASLKAAVVELRDQMELMRQEKEAAVQAVILRTHNEIAQLREIAAALRAQLESAQVSR
jgi:predicted flavoprotein YhiN